MLHRVREAVGVDRVVLTESNAEPFMSGVNLFLTLVGFSSGDLPAAQNSSSIIVPAFQAVYGGYVLPVGAEFFQQDFLPNPDVFAAKIAAQFIFGAQMGWFSLGGRDNQSPAMGVFGLMMDARYDAEITYLRSLSSAKLDAQSWFNHGRVMRPLELNVKITRQEGVGGGGDEHLRRHPRSSRLPDEVGLAFGSVMSSAWLSATNDSLLIVLTSVKRDVSKAEVSGTLDMSRYGFGAAARSERFEISPILMGTKQTTDPDDIDDGERQLTELGHQDLQSKGCSASFPGDAVEISASLGTRDIAMLIIQPCRE